MSNVLQILTTNYSGETVDIRVYPRNGVPYTYEQVTLPYNLYDGLFEGDYEVYIHSYNLTYKFTYPQTELPKDDEKCYCYKFENVSLTKKRASLSLVNCSGVIEKFTINGGSSIYKCVKSGQYTADTAVNIQSLSTCSTGGSCPPKVQTQECVCYKISGNQYEPYGSFTYLDCNTNNTVTQDFVYPGDTWFFQAVRGSVGLKNISSTPFPITPNTGTTKIDNIETPRLECGGPCKNNLINNPKFIGGLEFWNLEDINGNPLNPDQSWKYSKEIMGGSANYVGGNLGGCLVQNCLVDGDEYYVSFSLQMIGIPDCGGDAYLIVYAGNNYSETIIKPGQNTYSTTIKCAGGNKLKIQGFSNCSNDKKPISITNVCVISVKSQLASCGCRTFINRNLNIPPTGTISELQNLQNAGIYPEDVLVRYNPCNIIPVITEEIIMPAGNIIFINDGTYEYIPSRLSLCMFSFGVLAVNQSQSDLIHNVFELTTSCTPNPYSLSPVGNYYTEWNCAQNDIECTVAPDSENLIPNGSFYENISFWFPTINDGTWQWSQNYNGSLAFCRTSSDTLIGVPNILTSNTTYNIKMEVWFPESSSYIEYDIIPNELCGPGRYIKLILGSNFSENFYLDSYGGHLYIDTNITCIGGSGFYIQGFNDCGQSGIPSTLSPCEIFIQNVCVTVSCEIISPILLGCQVFLMSRNTPNIWSYNVVTNQSSILNLPSNDEPYRDIATYLNPQGVCRLYSLRNATASYNALTNNIKYWDLNFFQETCINEPMFITLPTPPFGTYESSSFGEGLATSVDGTKLYYSQGRWVSASPFVSAIVMYDTITQLSIRLISFPNLQLVAGDILRSSTKLWVVISKTTLNGVGQIFLQQYTCNDTEVGTTLDGEIFLWSISTSENNQFSTEIFIFNGTFYLVRNLSTGSIVFSVDVDGNLTLVHNNTLLGNLRGSTTYSNCNDSFIGFDFIDPRCRPLLVFGPYPVQQVNQPNVTVTVYQYATNVPDTQLNLNLPSGTSVVNFPGSDANITHTLNYSTNTGKLWILHRQTTSTQVIDEWNLTYVVGVGFSTSYLRRISVPSSIILGFGLCAKDNTTLIASRIFTNNLANANNPTQIIQINVSQTGPITLTDANITIMFRLPLAGTSFNTTNGVVNIPQNTSTVFNKVIVWADMVLTDTNQLIIKAKWNANPNVPYNNQLLLQYNYIQDLSNQPNFVHWYGTNSSFNNVKNSIAIFNENLWMFKQTSNISPGSFTIQQISTLNGQGSLTEVLTGVLPGSRIGPHGVSSPRLIPSTSINPCVTVDLTPNINPPPPLCSPLILFVTETNNEVLTSPILRIARWNFDNNTLIEITVPNLPLFSSNYRALDITHNLTINTETVVDGFLWISFRFTNSNTTSEIWEYKISGNNIQYNLDFNRIITVPYRLGRGISYAATNQLISSSRNHSNQRPILVNISTNTVSSTITELTGGFFPQTDSYEIRGIMLTTNGQIITRPSTQIATFNFFNNPLPATLCYAKSTQGVDGGIAANDGGFFQLNNGIIYWVSSTNQYYSIPNTQPYPNNNDNFVHAENAGTIPSLNNNYTASIGSSSLISCNTTSMDCE